MVEATIYSALSVVESAQVLSDQMYITSAQKAVKTCMHLVSAPVGSFLTCLEILSATLHNDWMAETARRLTPWHTFRSNWPQ